LGVLQNAGQIQERKDFLQKNHLKAFDNLSLLAIFAIQISGAVAQMVRA
jgi:hypothetical protein